MFRIDPRPRADNGDLHPGADNNNPHPANSTIIGRGVRNVLLNSALETVVYSRPAEYGLGRGPLPRVVPLTYTGFSSSSTVTREEQLLRLFRVGAILSMHAVAGKFPASVFSSVAYLFLLLDRSLANPLDIEELLGLLYEIDAPLSNDIRDLGFTSAALWRYGEGHPMVRLSCLLRSHKN